MWKILDPLPCQKHFGKTFHTYGSENKKLKKEKWQCSQYLDLNQASDEACEYQIGSEMKCAQRSNDIQNDSEISAQCTSDTQWSVLLNFAWLGAPLTQGSHQTERPLISMPNYIYCSGSRCQGTKLWFQPPCGVIGLLCWEPCFTRDGTSMSLIVGFIWCKICPTHISRKHSSHYSSCILHKCASSVLI